MTTLFATAFHAEPEATAKAPARANLLGEHTDYNDGFVLPTTLAFTTTVSVSRTASDGMVEAYSANFDETRRHTYGAPKQGCWLDYVAGCIDRLIHRGYAVPGLRVAINSDVPTGSGLSSSAALEVATLRALRQLLALDIDDATIAQIGREAENAFVGMPCGIMDQMASSLGQPNKALFIDTRTLERRLVPLPTTHQIVVLHSGVAHQLVDGGYAQRLAECREAAKRLGVAWLRDLSQADLPRIEALPEPLNRRARHQLTENQRVLDALDALENGDAQRFGTLMTGSHHSQRDDYHVSVPAVDRLVEAALAHGALGARLTGGGFGGCIVALVENNHVDTWLTATLADCPGAHRPT